MAIRRFNARNAGLEVEKDAWLKFTVSMEQVLEMR
jgi:hypothetical protein